jgi:hypothetical protein
MCTIAAPALAASIAEVAIWVGVTGTAGFLPGVSADPVTAQEIITLRCTTFLRCCLTLFATLERIQFPWKLNTLQILRGRIFGRKTGSHFS